MTGLNDGGIPMNHVTNHSHPSEFESEPQSAQDILDFAASLTAHDYESLLDDIRAGNSRDFLRLRLAYTHTEYYHPYDKALSDQHREMTRMIESGQFRNALETASNILTTVFTDIRSHLYSGFIHQQLDNQTLKRYHYDIVEGLLSSILTHGDGTTPRTAYVIISTLEEYELLDWQGFEMLSQRLTRKGENHYDVLLVRPRRGGNQSELYFNINLPFSHIDKLIQ
jgi:hypothetical protein